MENSKKLTKKEMFAQIMGHKELTQEEKDFLKHEIDLLAKKNKSNCKPTKAQLVNEKIMNEIVDLMEDNTLYTATDIQALFPNEDYSNQKITALLKKLKDNGQVIRTEDKGKALYQKA